MILQTEHPYVVFDPIACEGRPSIKGTTIAVDFVVRLSRVARPAEILASLPEDYLRPAALYSALSYYYDHLEEIDEIISENKRLR